MPILISLYNRTCRIGELPIFLCLLAICGSVESNVGEQADEMLLLAAKQ